jgi:hypothetical protein
MSRNIIFVLMYHCHKLLDLIFSVGFYFDSILILLTLTVKLCMIIGARPHVCVEILMFVLTSADGLCCSFYIVSCVGSVVQT